ncbi:MAG: hypothetical protein LBD99_06010 [Candidatus Margulisbacteria bacterium]|jgi:hypothetical protein|nr:hypothetical protein [Candidatus Margulisiibacteriota bacterium]
MEAIGLIEAIIAVVKDCPKAAWHKDKVVVESAKILEMLEKLKLVVQTDGQAAKNSIALTDAPRVRKAEVDPKIFGVEGEALIRQAKEEASNLRQAADEYAKNVLSNLQIVVNKMLRNLETGKERLKKYQGEEK